jgi:hypothetical protein
MYFLFSPRKHVGLLCCYCSALVLTAPDQAWSAPANTNKPPASPAPSAAPAAAGFRRNLAVDQLGQKELEAIIGRLRSTYIDQKALGAEEITQATVRGLLSRIGPGAYLQTGPEAEAAEPNHPFKSEIINGQFGYIRLGTLSKDLLPKLDSALVDLRGWNVSSLILDLRTSNYTSDFQVATDVLSRFLGRSKNLFELIQTNPPAEHDFTSDTDPSFQGSLAIIVGPNTAGPAEAIAGVLKAQAHALVLGEKTAGRAVGYQKFELGPGVFLNVAISEVRLANGLSLFPGGVSPDIVIAVPANDEDSILRATDTEPVTPYVNDEERPHNNEAALVAGRNPELDAYEAQANGKPSPQKLKDVVLQRALDFLTTISVLGEK